MQSNKELKNGFLINTVKEVRKAIRLAGGITTFSRLRRDLESRLFFSTDISEAITFMEETKEIIILIGRDIDGSSGPQVYYASQAKLEEGR